MQHLICKKVLVTTQGWFYGKETFNLDVEKYEAEMSSIWETDYKLKIYDI